MLLEVKNLVVAFDTYAGEVQAVRDVSFQLDKNEVLAIVGESGCGKSVTAQSIMQLVPTPPGKYMGGEILLNGVDLLSKSDKEMQAIRGKDIGMIFQDPMTSLNPTMTIGKQIAEVIRQHNKVEKIDKNGVKKLVKMPRKDALEKAVELLKLVEIPNAEERARQYPHEFSGGMRQRAMIAIALSCNPHLLIADEPTTALDVTIQAQVLDLMKNLQAKTGAAIIIITHDLGVVSNISEKIVVMYAGIIVESGTTNEIFYNPKHPYTWGLLKSVFKLNKDKNEKLDPIDGTPPDLIMPKGCPFADRCDYAMKICRDETPERYKISDTHYCSCWRLHPDSGYREQTLNMKGADVNE